MGGHGIQPSRYLRQAQALAQAVQSVFKRLMRARILQRLAQGLVQPALGAADHTGNIAHGTGMIASISGQPCRACVDLVEQRQEQPGHTEMSGDFLLCSTGMDLRMGSEQVAQPRIIGKRRQWRPTQRHRRQRYGQTDIGDRPALAGCDDLQSMRENTREGARFWLGPARINPP